MSAAAGTSAGGWVLAVIFAGALLLQSRSGRRRRSAINRGLHELRRPLQAMALSGSALAGAGPAEEFLELAIAALADIDAEVNRSAVSRDRRPAICAELLEAAAERWRGRAAMAGKRIDLRTQAVGGVRVGAPLAVARAVDNLLANAIEHGGQSILLDAWPARGRVRIRIADDGGCFVRRRRTLSLAPRGSGRRGHGLEVVRRVAAEQGGRFVLRRSEQRTVAHLELPALEDGDARAA